MAGTFDRHRGRWKPLLLGVAAIGAGVAGTAWLTSPLRSGPAADAALPGAPVAPGIAGAPRPAPDGRIHVPLFVDPALVRPTPRFRFTFDPPATLAAYRAEESLDAIVGTLSDDLERSMALMHWSRAQWEPGVPSPYPPIDARIILRDIRRGFTGGFCAQYNYVLVQALQSFGILARYVSLVEHEVIEVRLPGKRRWVCLDPLYDTIYRDDQGEPLSVYEIHRRGADGLPVILSNPALAAGKPSHMDSFRAFAVWLKNDHVGSPVNFTDLERYKVYFVPEGTAPAGVPAGALMTSEVADLYPG
jgi:transglutaminase-like putative cysteine protease